MGKNAFPPVVASLLFIFVPNLAPAADSFWKNATGGEFSRQNNWFGGIPGPTDRAVFTNNSNFELVWTQPILNSSALFIGSGSTVTQSIGAFQWIVTNQYAVTQTVADRPRVIHRSGLLAVTNASGTAHLKLERSGVFLWGGGSVVADILVATNNDSGTLDLDHGSLTTKSGSNIEILQSAGPAGLRIGNVPGQSFFWNVLGGTNHVRARNSVFPDYDGANIMLGTTTNSLGALRISGPATSWLGSMNTLYVGGAHSRGTMTIDQGALVSMYYLFLGDDRSTNNSLLVQGASTRLQMTQRFWSLSGVFVNGAGNRIRVAEGGAVDTDLTEIYGAWNNMTLTGPTTYYRARGLGGFEGPGFHIFGSTNIVIVEDGAELYVTGYLTIGSLAGLGDNRLVVRDGGMVRLDNGDPEFAINLATLRVGGFEGRGTLEIAGGSVVTDTLEFTYGTNSVIEFRHGTLTTKYLLGFDPVLLMVGDGNGLATLNLLPPEAGEHILGNLVLSSNATVNMYGGAMWVTKQLIATNGPTSYFNFESGELKTRGTVISNGLPFRVGAGTNEAILVLDGGTHVFANGLIVESNGTLFTGGVLTGDLTLNEDSRWSIQTSANACPGADEPFHVNGNVTLSGNLLVHNSSRFVPASYLLLTYTGALNTNGVQLSPAPPGFLYTLDASMQGELRVNVTFVGPSPADTIVNPVVCNGMLSLSFMTEVGKLYAVQTKEDLTQLTWLMGPTIVGNGRPSSIMLPASGLSMFVRLVISSN